MTVLVLLISTVCYGQDVSADRCPQDRTCLKADEMDYFLQRDARCEKLIKDSTEMAGKIDKYKINEAQFKANEADLKDQAKTAKTEAKNNKDSALAAQKKYSDEKDKSKFRGGALIGSLVVNLLFVIATVISIK